MVSRWGNISADNNGYLNNLERELYTWSIECKLKRIEFLKATLPLICVTRHQAVQDKAL